MGMRQHLAVSAAAVLSAGIMGGVVAIALTGDPEPREQQIVRDVAETTEPTPTETATADPTPTPTPEPEQPRIIVRTGPVQQAADEPTPEPTPTETRTGTSDIQPAPGPPPPTPDPAKQYPQLPLKPTTAATPTATAS